ncbi:MAG TPA: outer membrane protein assembly factor BamA [Ignavibacteriaceae bacterium]|nr:outer membrane protein assembly factor BamA [Ignavibacteriaceae bacterium]
MSQTFPKKLSKYIFLIALLCISTISYSQASKTSYKILGISVEGNKSADAATIIANSGLKVGDELQIPGDQTLNAIQQLWSLNIFSDVQILIDKQVSDGVFLLIKVKEYPRFEKIVFEGNDEIDDSKLEEQATFIRGQILKPQEVARLKVTISKLYEEDGYYNAQIKEEYFIYYSADTTDESIIVTWHNENDLSDEYKLTYNKSDNSYIDLITKIKDRILLKISIQENTQTTVRDVSFVGNKNIDDGDLTSEMDDIHIAKWWKFWQGSKFDPVKLKKDEEKIVKYYKKNGYRDAEVLGDSLIYSNNKEDVKILITVYEGPQYFIRNINWTGNTVFPDAVLNGRLGFQKGDVFNYEQLERNLHGNEQQSDISSLYLDNGYLTFNAIPEEHRVGKDSVDIDIKIIEKNQFKIGDVNILGNDKTMDKVIRRELYTIPGDYFNRGLLLRSIQQLANLKYFNVEKLYGPQGISTTLPNDSTVDVSFNVEEKSSDFLNASVGYSGSFGFSGAIGITLTNFSISNPFKLGGGQVLSFNWQFGVGSVYRTFSLGFTEPWMFNTPTSLGFQVFDTRQQYIYDLHYYGGTVTVGRRLKWPDDFFSVSGIFKYQNNDVLSGGGYYAEGKTEQFTLGATITRKNIDNPLFPSAGSNVVLDAEISGGPFLPGNVDFYKINFKSEWYRRLFNTNRITLYTVAEFGYLKEFEAGTEVNPFEYFFMGGNGLVIATTPLRGYEDRSIGPQNSSGQVIGGRVMTRYTAELRVSVTQEPIPFYLLGFAEAGNVYLNIEKTDPFNLRRSAGIGARILINPVGLIGFDLGYGFDRPIVDGSQPKWTFHFQFGKGF